MRRATLFLLAFKSIHPCLSLLSKSFASRAFLPPPLVALSAAKEIKEVAIVGSGISGLTLAHALSNSSVKVEMFEARSRGEEGGAGIQLNGGMAILNRIDPKLWRRAMEASLPLSGVKSMSCRGEALGELLKLDVPDLMRGEEELMVDGVVMSFAITREGSRRVLLEELKEEVGLHWGKELMEVTEVEGGKMLAFRDGSAAGPFDLVVGCDGVNSRLKSLLRPENPLFPSKIYSGIRIQYAMAEAPSSVGQARLRQYFGDGAYALRGTYGTNRDGVAAEAAYLIFNDDDYLGPFPREKSKRAEENADWKPSKGDIRSSFLRRLRQADIASREVLDVVEGAESFFELGVYLHNPFAGRWSRSSQDSYLALVGDAAHAMPPFLGQGANQAVQDAYCLATHVIDHNLALDQSNGPSFQDRLEEYERTRWRPTTEITLKAAFLGYLEIGGGPILSNFRNTFFFVLGKLGVAGKVYLDGARPKV